MSEIKSDIFQHHMPENVCFGCGVHNAEGLQIQSSWDGEVSVCEWIPEEKYHGWANLLNGGIMATLIDCHCMCTAMADAYRRENRLLDSFPEYRYATGTLNIKYLKPTSTLYPVRLEAKVIEVKGRKTVLICDFYSQGEKTATAEVVALLVYDSSAENTQNPFKH
jgi:acyl-coenzyme A thioesterase PaaI-like protein